MVSARTREAMVRVAAGVALAALTVVSPQGLAMANPASGVAQASGVSAYDFHYRLSGDRRVAPVQVFDDGRHTWLQYPPDQVLPAIFAAVEPSGPATRLVTWQQQGPYLMVAGTVPALEMRIGSVAARADYIGKAPRSGLALAEGPARSLTPSSLLPADRAAPIPAAQSSSTTPVASFDVAASSSPQGSAMAQGPSPSVATRAATSAARPTPTATVEPIARVPAVLEFDAAVADKNMRRVLQRWARQAGWTFGPEHWTVDVDIPLVAAAAFGADFRSAVRDLLAATELAERPLQPCFYSNRVLRVVPLMQACDRTVAPGAMPPVS